ncbi:SDR family NAD(P)-dependent oxidoreductase [Pantoea agglomerans]|uniref:SDR family NAD(P)-dependent oxidoreductase n=1 Tax=Enterobacter agglomerans TaxID=549 RepID=UPI000F04215A|nr:SDR family NAD(P)-dependent oxidoreductase [Pantoea agglomerans]AYP25834.1 SDR family NAD(P)-dependent oxidoreductase [Pantoea agglomerans]
MNSFTGTTEQATSDSRPVALIAGATEGVGQQCTFELIRAGYRVVALSRSDIMLEDLSRRALEAGPAGSLITLRADITAAQAAQHIRQNAERKLGRLDLLLLSAGITSNKSTGLNDTEVTTVNVMAEPGHEIEPKIQVYIHDKPDANLHALLADIELFLDGCDDTERDFRTHYKGEFVPANWDTTAQAFLARVQERVSAALKKPGTMTSGS